MNESRRRRMARSSARRPGGRSRRSGRVRRRGLGGAAEGTPPARVDLRSGSAWVGSSLGLMTLIDGDSGEVEARVDIGAASASLVTTQYGAVGYAVNGDTGAVVRVDPRTFVPSPPVRAGPRFRPRIGPRHRRCRVRLGRRAGSGRHRRSPDRSSGRARPVAGRTGGIEHGRQRRPVVAARLVQWRPGLGRRGRAARPGRGRRPSRRSRPGGGGWLPGGGGPGHAHRVASHRHRRLRSRGVPGHRARRCHGPLRRISRPAAGVLGLR
jgi:hypothetical protein